MGKHKIKRVGKPHTPERRANISAALKIRFSDPEIRRKMSESHKGKTPSEYAREKMREAGIRKWKDPEYRERTTKAIAAAMNNSVKSKRGNRKKRPTVRERAIESAKRLLKKAENLTQGK